MAAIAKTGCSANHTATAGGSRSSPSPGRSGEARSEVGWSNQIRTLIA